jgi:hypothetical protein
MDKQLTIGMATFDDYDGLFFTIQALRIYHDIPFDIIVIDNNPDGTHGKSNKSFVENWTKGTGKYIPFTDKVSTSCRNEIFNHSKTEYTLCMDSHVMIEPNGLQNLMAYYKENPDTKNLVQGPLWYDDLTNCSTHFTPVWRDNMYGIWGTDKENLEKVLPFEIPMMGLGLFSCKTSEWQGFNEKFKGFGGEEGYIHEKFRMNGGKCICLPDLKWNHRFNRPNGIPYPNILEDRIWNYFVGWLEIYKDPEHPFIKEIIDHFSESMPKSSILSILEKVKQI